jgi:multimeric flavodoxin WrbA
MKLMAIIGSPRKGGNTELLVDRVIEGCKSTKEVEIEKFFVIDKAIGHCTGCMSCVLPSSETGTCVIDDDMTYILKGMEESDAFIFGSPNHMRTITAPLLNFLSRMLPLLIFRVTYDDKGNRVGGEMSSKIQDKQAAIVISQGEPFFCSSLVYEVLENNLNDFRLKRVGNIISMGNAEKGAVVQKKEDLKKAFDLGIHLGMSTAQKV